MRMVGRGNTPTRQLRICGKQGFGGRTMDKTMRPDQQPIARSSSSPAFISGISEDQSDFNPTALGDADALDQSPEADQTMDIPDSIHAGQAALVEFYAQLNLSDEDERLLFEKRGLTSITSRALGFRSNPRSNQQIIESMVAAHGWSKMITSGLALAADPEHKLDNRVNMQFCGKGQTGKILKSERKNPNIKSKWGWSLPPFIPYFDTDENVITLRPHKGGAPARTAAGSKSLYIPRAFTPPFDGPEKFNTVVITEGEFKAAALWQTVGVGARQFVDEHNRPLFNDEPYGICAVPGISYAKHIETRALLEDWLRSVGCRRVIVGFDYEIKWDPALASYEEDPNRRYDSLAYAFYLASDLSQKLRLQGRVCLLPKAWTNANGKADWDGALATIVHGQTSVAVL